MQTWATALPHEKMVSYSVRKRLRSDVIDSRTPVKRIFINDKGKIVIYS